MFYKNLNTWGQKKVYKWLTIFYAIFGTLTIVVPSIIVAARYNLFKTESFKLTAVGLILAIIVLVVSIKCWNRVVNRINEDKPKTRHLKYVLQLISAVTIPASIMIILYLTYDSWAIAYKTIMPILGCYIAAMVVHYIFIKDLEWLIDVRAEARHKKIVEEQTKYI